MTTDTKEDTRSEDQAAAQLESIIEMVRALNIETMAEDFAQTLTKTQCRKLLLGNTIKRPSEDTTESWREAVAKAIQSGDIEPDGFTFDEDEARQTIQEDALSVEVRADWHAPGDTEGAKPSEYCILLCAGGPAVRIIGDLSEHGEPETAHLEHQDWFKPWTEYTPASNDKALLRYAGQFLFEC